MAKPPDIRPTHNRALPPGHVVGRLSGNDPTRSADGRLISMDDLAHAMIGTGRIASSAITLRYFKLATQRAQRAAGVALMYEGDGGSEENTFVIGPGIPQRIRTAPNKTTPVDADQLGLVDSAASNTLAHLTWANTKATLKTYFDTLYGSYAETSWTPTLTCVTPGDLAVTYSVQSGTAVKIGNLVVAIFTATAATWTWTTASGSLIVDGMPYQPNASLPNGTWRNAVLTSQINQPGVTTYFSQPTPGTTQFRLVCDRNGNTAVAVTIAATTSGTPISIGGTVIYTV